MNRGRLSLALAAFTVWAGGCLAWGDEDLKAPPVVYLGRSSAFSLSAGEAEVCGRVLTEMARQSFLVAARDELGLRTRDAWLGDAMPGSGDNASFEVLMTGGPQNMLEVRRGFSSPQKTLLRHDLKVGTTRLDAPGREPVFGVDYRAVLVKTENLSRSDYVDAIRKVGFQGKPNVRKESADIPREIQQSLDEMNFLSQFSAVRQLHALIRADGESPERLGALVRGYAHLGLLTEFHWHPAHKAFTARSLVYAQRMVATGKEPRFAGWHRAYALALAGLHKLALDDLAAAGQGKAAKDGSPHPDWVDLIDAYCRYDYERLKAAALEGPGKEPATVLWFDSIRLSHCSAATIRAAIATVGKIPECYPAYDCLCQLGGVSVGHGATGAPLAVAGRTIYPRVAAMPGLPEAAGKITHARQDRRDGDQEGPPVEEFSDRAKLMRALLESDGPLPATKAAPPARTVEKPAAPAGSLDAATDCGEPSWVSLGRLISNLSFVHAWRRVEFEDHSLGVSADDFRKAAAGLIEAHPCRLFLGTYGIVHNQAAVKEAWNQFTLPNLDDLEYQANPMWREYLSHHPGTAGIPGTIYTQTDVTPRDFAVMTLQRLEPAYDRWSALLLAASPFSPEARAVAIEFCGDHYAARFAEWEKTAAQHPAVTMAFARRAKAAARWEEAEKRLKSLADEGDMDALWQLANIYELRGKMDLWVATLEQSLQAPDFGLSHAGAQTRIARYYMYAKQWEKALPYAKGAAESYSEWGLRVEAECLEAQRDWKAAEAIYRAIGECYSVSVLDWYLFCRRTGQGDLPAARRAVAEYAGNRTLATPNAPAYYLLEKDLVRTQAVLKHHAHTGHPAVDLHLAIVADQVHDNRGRDQALARVKSNAASYKWPGGRENYAPLAALAGLIADDLAKGGKGAIDLAAAERLNPPQPFEAGAACDSEIRVAITFPYLLGRYLDLHGKPELAVRCWKQCLAQTQFIAEPYRTLAAAELLSRKIRLEPDESRPEEPAGKPKSPQ